MADRRRLPSRGDNNTVVVVDSLDRKNAMAVLRKTIREAPDLLRKMFCAWLDFRVVAVYRTCMHFTGMFKWIKVYKLIKSQTISTGIQPRQINFEKQTQKIYRKIQRTPFVLIQLSICCCVVCNGESPFLFPKSSQANRRMKNSIVLRYCVRLAYPNSFLDQ